MLGYKYINSCSRNLKYFSTKSSRNLDYQYIQRSKVPTLHFQKSLLRLPIPELKKTCDRYLAAQRPLLDDRSFQHVTSQVNLFANGIGMEIDKLLRSIDKQNKHTSYISKMWFDMYLSDRIPLPINYNPVLIHHNNPKPEFNDQLIKASNMLISSIRFLLSLRNNILDPEVFHLNPKKSDTDLFRKVTGFLPSAVSSYGAYAFKAFPLDMSQYNGLFGASRIPEMDTDRIVNDYKSKHVLVQRKGHFYAFDVLDEEGYLIQPSQILSRLKYIMSDERPPAEYPVGILTTQDRDVWASQRHYLCQVGNEKNMKTLDSALFNLVLDDIEVGNNEIKTVRNYLHGDGTNRWFDKSFSLIITKDGVSGVNFEHSWGDGVAVLRYFQDIYRDTIDKPFVTPETKSNESDSDQFVKKIDFNLDDKLKENITNANKAYKEWYSSLGMDFLIFDEAGRDSCKKYKISPDSMMQLGFQAAYHSMTGKFVGTYESCSTAAFKHGRTETMRPLTVHTKAFCESLHSASTPSDSELAKMLITCSATHTQLVKEAAMGQGFDRHLFALRKLAEMEGLQPGLFGDAEYKLINKSVLSTSSLTSPAVMGGGFGPVVSDGLGIGYTLTDKSFGTLVTSYPAHNSGNQFVDALKIALKDINRIMKTIKKD